MLSRHKAWVLEQIADGRLYPVVRYNARVIEIFDCAISDFLLRSISGSPEPQYNDMYFPIDKGKPVLADDCYSTHYETMAAHAGSIGAVVTNLGWLLSRGAPIEVRYARKPDGKIDGSLPKVVTFGEKRLRFLEREGK